VRQPTDAAIWTIYDLGLSDATVASFSLNRVLDCKDPLRRKPGLLSAGEKLEMNDSKEYDRAIRGDGIALRLMPC